MVSELGSKFYSKEVASRIPTFFFSMAICWAVLAVIAIIFVRRNPALKNEHKKTAQDFNDMLTLGEGIRHPQF